MDIFAKYDTKSPIIDVSYAELLNILEYFSDRKIKTTVTVRAVNIYVILQMFNCVQFRASTIDVYDIDLRKYSIYKIRSCYKILHRQCEVGGVEISPRILKQGSKYYYDYNAFTELSNCKRYIKGKQPVACCKFELDITQKAIEFMSKVDVSRIKLHRHIQNLDITPIFRNSSIKKIYFVDAPIVTWDMDALRENRTIKKIHQYTGDNWYEILEILMRNNGF